MLRRTRRQIIVLCLMAVFLISSVAPAWAATVKRPSIDAGGAITYCQNTGEIIYAKNKNKKFAPYSTTKMMTALVAAESDMWEDVVTVSLNAQNQEGSKIYLKAGEKIKGRRGIRKKTRNRISFFSIRNKIFMFCFIH